MANTSYSCKIHTQKKKLLEAPLKVLQYDYTIVSLNILIPVYNKPHLSMSPPMKISSQFIKPHLIFSNLI